MSHEPTVININIGSPNVPFRQPLPPHPPYSSYPTCPPVQIQKKSGWLDFDIDNYWIGSFVFLFLTGMLLYPSFDSRILVALRGDAAGGNIDSVPVSSVASYLSSPKNAAEGRKRIAEIALADAASGLKYKPNQSARCADYVENVLQRAGWNIKDTITKEPLDQFRQTGKYMANRFAGPDIGTVITNVNDLQPGDLVVFRNTYGNWERGAITHVAIVVSKKMIVDRGTASAPVLHRSINTFNKDGENKIVAGIRLHDKWFIGR